MPFDALVSQTDRAVLKALGGELVTYKPAVGPPVSVTGLFDSQYALATGTVEAGVETLGPAIFLRLEDLPKDPEDDDPVITIRLLTYRVIGRFRDGIGGIVLALRRVT